MGDQLFACSYFLFIKFFNVWQEELRNGIISMVKQSAALNRPGAENLKPHQLSDAIHQEVGYAFRSMLF